MAKKIKFIDEFKAFITKGNVLDLAVGVIIGGAFSKIISSLVNDLIMPVIGIITGGIDLTAAKWVMVPAVMQGGEVVKPEVALLWGSFLQNVLDFLLIALSVFLLVKLAGKTRALFERKKKEEAAAPAGPTETQLLTEIRDLLRERKEP